MTVDKSARTFCIVQFLSSLTAGLKGSVYYWQHSTVVTVSLVGTLSSRHWCLWVFQRTKHCPQIVVVRNWIVHLTPIPYSLFHFYPNLARLPHCVGGGFLLVKVCALAWKCVPLVDLLNGLLWAGRNGLPPTPNNLHLGCSYHLHSSHRFLSTWGAVTI